MIPFEFVDLALVLAFPARASAATPAFLPTAGTLSCRLPVIMPLKDRLHVETGHVLASCSFANTLPGELTQRVLVLLVLL